MTYPGEEAVLRHARFHPAEVKIELPDKYKTILIPSKSHIM